MIETSSLIISIQTIPFISKILVLRREEKQDSGYKETPVFKG
jgi:hypothetical protein